MQKAVQLLVDQANAAGGINGQQVELIVEDDKGDPKEAALVADRMVSNKVAAVIGAYNSSATEPASVTYNRNNILHITPSSTRSASPRRASSSSSGSASWTTARASLRPTS